jgi:imidazole glycerol-phosphate synthase subunit HisH
VSRRIAIVEYGAGNPTSVARAFAGLGVATERAGTPEQVAAADALVLPGVGHFGALLAALERTGVREALRTAIAAGKPFLGICVGLQILFAASDEAPDTPGLGCFPERVVRLPAAAKLPHMGWNQVRLAASSQLLSGIADGTFFYFAHSYAALQAGTAACAFCENGGTFVAALERKNIFAVQFHPEKSAEMGAAVLANFARAAGVPQDQRIEAPSTAGDRPA